ncbi:MAG TPA: hypothetical protein H9738_09245 [Candidatus Blautia pullistercoris]|uniref:Uncharacterized protein n=1 Tax=Candidatus Blautia pullistercoris TaxID=2838499 RepID=A0A9D1VM88_9FIRM|nr:hypothetical protein [Candidatus Blautia pullistercoris]
MELRSVRHDKALHLAEQKILCSRLAPEKKGNREIKREIIYLKGSITEEDIDAPEIDLKVVFGDDWKKSSQTYYRNILQEGKQIWQKI